MKHQDDKEIRVQIQKDVTRTNQENIFFRLQDTKDRLQEILYIWAREHPEYKYQQGMNEILAGLVSAVFTEFN